MVAFAQVKELLGNKPLMLDLGFNYLELFENLVAEGVDFVLRQKVSPNFWEGKENRWFCPFLKEKHVT
jgi:hypothetical protein